MIWFDANGFWQWWQLIFSFINCETTQIIIILWVLGVRRWSGNTKRKIEIFLVFLARSSFRNAFRLVTSFIFKKTCDSGSYFIQKCLSRKKIFFLIFSKTPHSEIPFVVEDLVPSKIFRKKTFFLRLFVCTFIRQEMPLIQKYISFISSFKNIFVQKLDFGYIQVFLKKQTKFGWNCSFSMDLVNFVQKLFSNPTVIENWLFLIFSHVSHFYISKTFKLEQNYPKYTRGKIICVWQSKKKYPS